MPEHLLDAADAQVKRGLRNLIRAVINRQYQRLCCAFPCFHQNDALIVRGYAAHK